MRIVPRRAELRVALAGAGWFAREHVAGWEAAPRARLVAVADLDAARAGALAPEDASVHGSVARMLRDVRPDILDIAAPPAAHAPLIRAALKADVPAAICQKPFCRTLEEARSVVTAARIGGLRLIVHENFRFMPWWRGMKDALEAGMVGEPFDVTFRLRPGDGQGPDAYRARQPYFRIMPRFLLHETGVHLIDVFRHLLGEPDAVWADLRRLNPAIKGEDAGLLRLRFASGARATLDANRLADHPAPDLRRTMGEGIAEGADGVLAFGGDGALLHRRRGARDWTPAPMPPLGPGFGGGCVAAFEAAAAEAVAEGAPFGTEAETYLANLAIEEAAYAAAETGAWTAPLAMT